MSLSEDIKNYALNLGFDYVGIISADGFSGYLEDLQDRYEMYQFGIEGTFKLLQAADPRQQMSDARSIISVAYDYNKESFPEELCKKIGRFYLSRAQPSSRYSPINLARRKLMREFLTTAGCKVGDQVAIPERLAAVRAGIANYGRNSFAYAKQGGSFCILGSFVVDVELEYDQPAYEDICPENCNICMEACPTKAIYEPYNVDPRKCITLSNMSAGNVPGLPRVIPHEMREKLGVHIHGCDICQEVCPLNKQWLRAQSPVNTYLENLVQDFQLPRILNMDENSYQNRVRPLVYNYFNKRKYLQRNAAIALGNLGDPTSIQDLRVAMGGDEEMVRAYSAWALGQIGGKAPSQEIYTSSLTYADWVQGEGLRKLAEQVLEEALGKETSEWVIREIREALVYIGESKVTSKFGQLIM